MYVFLNILAIDHMNQETAHPGSLLHMLLFMGDINMASYRSLI